MSKKLDLTGQRFGKLTALEVARSKQGFRAWLCLCDCGNQVTIETDRLRNGNSKTCGCSRKGFIDLTGQVFGRLTVLREDPNKRRRETRWICRCQCEKEISIEARNLRGGLSQSCGCLHREQTSLRFRLPVGVAAMNQILRRSKAQAIERGYEWALSKEQVLVLMQQPCHYCGALPSNISRGSEYNGEYIYNGIDRVDNTQGYIEKNVVSSCRRCNVAKHTQTIEEFCRWITRVHNYFVLKKGRQIEFAIFNNPAE